MSPEEASPTIPPNSHDQIARLRARLNNLIQQTQGKPQPTVEQFHLTEEAWNKVSNQILALTNDIANKMMATQPIIPATGKKSNRAQKREASPKAIYLANLYTAQVHELMLLWLETRLYRARYISNNDTAYDAGEVSQEEDNLDLVETEIRRYQEKIDEIDRNARRSANARLLRHFKQYSGEATSYMRLRKTFGPDGTPISEHGWILIAADVGDALRFQYYNALMHRYRQWNVPSRWVSSVWLFIFKYTTGFGVKPLRLLYATIAIIVAFTGLYLVNDAIFGDAACQRDVWSLQSLLSHFYVAVTNLQGGGTAASCGNGFRLVQSVEIFSGYFILAILSGLVLNKLLETES